MTSMAIGSSRLFSDLDVDVEADAPLGPRTWFGVGGRADALVRPRSEEALSTLVERCHRDGVALRVLGEGANLLVADEGVSGVVVRLDADCFRERRLNVRGAVEGVRLMAGADLARCVLETTRSGFAGLGGLAGIPASIGGAVRMNAGGAFGSIGDRLHAVGCLDRRGELVVAPASSLNLGYRRCELPGEIVLWASFTLDEGDPVRLRSEVAEVFAYKRSTQPLAEHSAGCMFRNPREEIVPPEVRKAFGGSVSAGGLVDRAGLKGLAHGGASISTRHANFVVVKAGATAGDILALSEVVADRVEDRFGVRLEREVVVWNRTPPEESR